MMKKITYLMLIISLFINLINLPANANQELQYDSEIAFLKAIDLLDSDFTGSEKITKSEFLSIVINMLFRDVDFSSLTASESVFSDVDTTHQYYDIIKAAKDMNIVQGDAGASFLPDSEIGFDVAATILLNALNYKLHAYSYGGYPTGYLYVAKQTGILDELAVTGDTITGNVAAKLIYNALFVNCVDASTLTEDGYTLEVDSGKNILWEKFNIKEYDAQIADNGLSSLYGSSVEDSERVVLKNLKNGESLLVDAGASDISNYLGFRVKAFIKFDTETDRNEIIHYDLHKNIRSAALISSKIISCNNGYIEYEENYESGKYKQYKTTQAPTVILNDICYYTYNSLSDVIPEDGIVTLLDNNSDGTYEIISVLSFNVYENNLKGITRNIVVDRVNADNNTIYCKLNALSNLELDPEKCSYKIISDSNIISLEDLKPYDIVSIAQAPSLISGKAHYILCVTRNKISGNISSISEETKEIYINDTMYKVSGSLINIKRNFISNLQPNTGCEFNIDAVGKIAYSPSIKAGSKNYGYLINIGNEASPENSLIIKLFNKDGEIKTYPLSPKTKIDSVQYSSAADMENALKRRPSGSSTDSISRPVIFKENSKGEITEIETDTPNYALNTGEYTPYATQTHIKYSIDEINDNNAFKAAYRTFRLTEYKESTASFDGKFIITSDTVIMSVPDIDLYGLDRGLEYSADQPATSTLSLNPSLVKLYETTIDDKNYKLMSVTSLSNVYSYDAQAYDIDTDTGVAGLVVLRGTNDATYYGNVPYNSTFKMGIFLKTTEVYDEETESIQTKVYWTTDGEEIQSAIVEKDELLYSYKYLFDGCNPNHTDYTANGIPPCEIYQAFKGVSNYSKEPVEALVPGDVVRIMSKKGRLTHIERVVDLSKINNTVCTNLYPTNLRYPYSPSLTGINAYSETYGMPNDVRAYWAGPNNSYSITLAKPNAVSSSTLRCFIGQSKFSDINLSNPSTYSEAYLNLADVPIIHVKLLKDGSAKVIRSDSSCIKSYQETGSLDTVTNLVMKYVDYRVEQLFVIETEV